jgi:hypothetical protein
MVFKVDVQYIAVLDVERQASVASDVQAPDPLTISGELMCLWTKLVILTGNTVARRLTPVN